MLLNGLFLGVSDLGLGPAADAEAEEDLGDENADQSDGIGVELEAGVDGGLVLSEAQEGLVLGIGIKCAPSIIIIRRWTTSRATAASAAATTSADDLLILIE